jgi:hypothetical protein
MSRLIFKTLAGSRLYGVSTEDSDYDYKGVFMEDLCELLKKTDDVRRATDPTSNSEVELFSLNYYMKLLGQGQVTPLDMLFAPKELWTDSSKEWEAIQAQRKYMVSSNITPFVDYAKGQAIKYGFKGNKILTIEKAIKLVELNFSFDNICTELADMDGISFDVEKTSNRTIRHIVICGKSFGETTKVNLWLDPLQKLRKSFGRRAEQVAGGIDLKAQYHTIRICCEAVELLTTGELTFPRPEADTLIKIRAGEFTSKQLEAMVEKHFEMVKFAEENTSLPAKPNTEKMNQLVYNLQANYLAEFVL